MRWPSSGLRPWFVGTGLDLPPLWGAPSGRSNCLSSALDVGQTSVAKYMARRRGGPSQGWRTSLCNHADGIASMDLFVVPTLSFRLLYGFLVLRHHRRRIMWLGVTANPTAEWIARQVTEACGWEAAPDYVVRDRDCAYGEAYVRRLRAMDIRDDQRHRNRHGRTRMLNGRLTRSGGRYSTMSLCLANGTFGTCCDRT